MADITAANAIILFSVPLVLPVPQQLQGFSADDVFSSQDVDATDVLMGVDGVLSGGMIFAAKHWEITLQADSASNTFFDAWYAAQQANMAAYPATAIVTLTAINTTYAMTKGFLSRYSPMSSARKVLQPRKFTIMWESILPAPVGIFG